MASADSATIDVELRVVDLTDEEFADYGVAGFRPTDECPPPDADIAILEAHGVRMLQVAGAMRARQAHLEKVIEAVVKYVTESYQMQIDAAEKTKTWALSQLKLTTEVLQDRGRFAKSKTCKTPFGAFGIRKTRDKLEVTDEATALAFLKELDLTLIRTIDPGPAREAVDKAATLKRLLEANAETTPGLMVTRGSEEFFYVLDRE